MELQRFTAATPALMADRELGFALGLFAVFGILRYRTDLIRLRDLMYMFIVIPSRS